MKGNYGKSLKLLMVLLILSSCVLIFIRPDGRKNEAREASQPRDNLPLSGKNHFVDSTLAKSGKTDVNLKTKAMILKQSSPVRNSELSLWQGAERAEVLDRNRAMAGIVNSASQTRFSQKSEQTWNREMELRGLSRQLRSGMTISQATNILGMPSKTGTVTFHPDGPEFPGMLMNHTNGTWLIYSPHPDRIDMRIGDDFRVLELWFNPAGELADGSWMKPVRN